MQGRQHKAPTPHRRGLVPFEKEFIDVEPNPKVIAFDCDGVMFDSREANRAYYNHMLEKANLPTMTPEQMEYVHMHTVDESMRFLITDTALREEIQAYRRQLGYLPFLKHMQMEPDLVPLLERLRPRYKTAVATNRTDTMARVLDENGIAHLFDLVVTALDVAFPKPHPEALNKVAAAFSAAPHEVLYVGDSKVDELAARAASMPFVAYANPSLEADHHIQRLAQIEGLLGIG